MRLLALSSLAALLACRPSPSPPSPPADAAQTSATATTAPETQADPPPEVEPATEPEDDGGHGVLHDDLNARYREETDVAQWQARFERPSREVAKRRADIVAEVGLRPGDRVADIGAGTGLYTFAFADAVGAKGRVFAVDVQDYFLQHLADQAHARGVTNVQTVHATQRAVTLPAGSIDVAFMCDAYHHIEHPAPYLATLYAALRPGGRFVVVDYAKVEGAKPFIVDHLRASPEEFRAEIEAAGFRFVRAADILDENFLFVFERP